jgi:dTDP-4-amino-4,6-dideoxygalactose transaminase
MQTPATTRGDGSPSTPNAGVPLCDLNAQFQELRPQLEEAVRRVLASGQVILGPEVAALEAELARWCGARHAIGCGSGTDALLLALCALNIGPGDEVILPPFTFFATAGSVVRCGARPVFADIDPVTYNLDPAQVEHKITDRTRALLPVHLYGQCADMEPLQKIADRYGLAVIEDAAQSLGAEYQGRQAGTIGTIGCFSFYPTKNLGGYGDSGMVMTDDAELAARLACLRVHGMEPKYFHKYLGWNARIDAVQAALLRVKLPYLDRWLQAREQAARRYTELLQEHGLTDFLAPPTALPGRRHVFNQYVVRVADGQRDALLQYLKTEGIGCEIYYPMSLHRQECLAYLGYRDGDFPVSEEACRCVLALPMFPEITAEQQKRVVQSCAVFARQRSRRAA